MYYICNNFKLFSFFIIVFKNKKKQYYSDDQKCCTESWFFKNTSNPSPFQKSFLHCTVWFSLLFFQKGNACGLLDASLHFKLQLSSEVNCCPKMKDFLTNFPFRELSIFVTIVGSFTYNILLERDMACTCKQGTPDCGIYMALPTCIIFILILWTDKKFKTACKFTFACRCESSKKDGDSPSPSPAAVASQEQEQRQEQTKCCRTELCGVLLTRILKAGCVGLLWVVSVLMDGDWYVCCNLEKSNNRTNLACKDKQNITAEENIIIIEMKNYSRVSSSYLIFRLYIALILTDQPDVFTIPFQNIGFVLLFGIIFLAALMSLFDWKRCCECCCRRRIVFDTVILEEGEYLLKEILTVAAKEELTRTIFNQISETQKDWIECLDAAAKMVEKSSEPKLSKKQEQLKDELQMRPQEMLPPPNPKLCLHQHMQRWLILFCEMLNHGAVSWNQNFKVQLKVYLVFTDSFHFYYTV